MFPFNFTISLTNRDEIIWFSTSDIKNNVSILEFNFLFIPANWNSYSKSDTALKPLNIIFDLYFLHKSVVNDVKETIIGTAQILEIFKVSGAGKVAGSKIVDGEIQSNSDVRIIRDGAIIYIGKVGTLFREKNQVKQVSNGQECGITVKDYVDFQKNDTIEAFSVTSTERSI